MSARYAIAVCLASISGQAQASTILDSFVTTNGGLYTYNYVVDNTGTTSISELGIRISPDFIHPPMPSYSAPSGWILSETVSGSVANPPYNEPGSFFDFTTMSNSISPGTLANFSFSVLLPPSFITVNGIPQNNYFIDGSSGITAFGVALAPNFGSTPIPPTLTLFSSGLAIISLVAWRTRRKRRHARPITSSMS